MLQPAAGVVQALDRLHFPANEGLRGAVARESQHSRKRIGVEIGADVEGGAGHRPVYRHHRVSVSIHGGGNGGVEIAQVEEHWRHAFAFATGGQPQQETLVIHLVATADGTLAASDQEGFGFGVRKGNVGCWRCSFLADLLLARFDGALDGRHPSAMPGRLFVRFQVRVEANQRLVTGKTGVVVIEDGRTDGTEPQRLLIQRPQGLRFQDPQPLHALGEVRRCQERAPECGRGHHLASGGFRRQHGVILRWRCPQRRAAGKQRRQCQGHGCHQSMATHCPSLLPTLKHGLLHGLRV